MKTLIIAANGFVGSALAVAALAQSPNTRVVGRTIGGGFTMSGRTSVVVETVKLTFPGENGGPTFAVEFTARYDRQTTDAVTAVDMTVSELPTEDDSPQMAMSVDGNALPLIARLRARRSMVATISLAEFEQLARGSTVVGTAFRSDLEFSTAQLGMLRATADRWAGRR